MPTPLSEVFAAALRSDPTAALAALMVINTAHRDLFAWATRALAEPPAARKPNGKQARGGQNLPRVPRGTGSTRSRKAKSNGSSAYHARRRGARDEADSALLEAMRSAPDALIHDYAEAIGKSRSSTLSALKRLREAGLAESIEGKWRLVEEPAPQEPAPKWISPLPAPAGRARAHA